MANRFGSLFLLPPSPDATLTELQDLICAKHEWVAIVTEPEDLICPESGKFWKIRSN
jgi:hypothetical protein